MTRYEVTDNDAIGVADRIKTEAELAEAHPDLTDEEASRGTRRNRVKGATLSLRIDADEYSEIERIAKDRGVPVSAVVRGWISQMLNAERAPVDSVAELGRITFELKRLYELTSAKPSVFS